MQSDTLGDVGAEEVVDSLADTLAEVEDEIVGDTMDDVESEALLDTLANTVKLWRARHFARDWAIRHWSTRLDSRAKTLQEVERKTHDNILDDLDAEAVVDNLANTLATSDRGS